MSTEEPRIELYKYSSNGEIDIIRYREKKKEKKNEDKDKRNKMINSMLE